MPTPKLFLSVLACLALGYCPAFRSRSHHLRTQPTPPHPSHGMMTRPASLAPSKASGLWSVDLIVGLPTGFRFRRHCNGDEDRHWSIEGLVGSVPGPFGPLLYVGGAGIRRCRTLACGEFNALYFNPGLDAYVVAADRASGFGVFAVDFDLLWQCRLVRIPHPNWG